MRELLLSIKRAPYQSLASLLILFFTLTLALFFFNLTSFFYGILTYVETRPQVIVYFDVNAKEKDIMTVKKELDASGKTTSVNYVSQKEALKIYRELNKDNPLLLEMVSADILPASLEVFAKEPEYLSEIASFLKEKPITDEVSYQQDIVDRLLTLTEILRKISIAIFTLLITITIVVLMTTTAFKIALKKDEIELMQLIGATKWYVRKPFLIEGAIFGFFAGTVSFCLLLGTYLYFKPFISSYLLGIPNLQLYSFSGIEFSVWPPNIYYLAFSYILITIFGAVIGLMGNFLSTSKYIS